VTANAELRNRSIVLRGRTDAKRVIDVTAEVAGQVVAQPAERGMQVAKGDLLCEIAIDDREIAVDEARAGLEKARIEHEGSMQLADQGAVIGGSDCCLSVATRDRKSTPTSSGAQSSSHPHYRAVRWRDRRFASLRR
jgi:multidrug efflux pump subunit AcrA (membrane-fusion protein)